MESMPKKSTIKRQQAGYNAIVNSLSQKTIQNINADIQSGKNLRTIASKYNLNYNTFRLYSATYKRTIRKKQISAKPIAKKPIPKKPIAKKPISKKPIQKKPIAKKPIQKKPIAKKPISKKPIQKKPIAKKPIAKKPIPKKPISAKPIAKKPIAKKPIPKKPISAKSMPKKPIKQKIPSIPLIPSKKKQQQLPISKPQTKPFAKKQIQSGQIKSETDLSVRDIAFSDNRNARIHDIDINFKQKTDSDMHRKNIKNIVSHHLNRTKVDLTRNVKFYYRITQSDGLVHTNGIKLTQFSKKSQLVNLIISEMDFSLDMYPAEIDEIEIEITEI